MTTSNTNNNNVTVTIELEKRDADLSHRQEYAERIAAQLRIGDYRLKPPIKLEMVIIRASEGSASGRIWGIWKQGWAKLWVKWTLKHRRGDTILFERLEKCESHGFFGLKDFVDANQGQKVLLGRLQEDMIRNIRIKAHHMLENQKNPGERPDVTCL